MTARVALVALAFLLGGCSADLDGTSGPSSEPSSGPSSSVAPSVAPSTLPTSMAHLPTTITPVPTTVRPVTTPPPATTTPPPTLPPTTLPTPPQTSTVPPPATMLDGQRSLPSIELAAAGLAIRNLGTSVTVIRDHREVYSSATGFTNGGSRIDAQTPFVLASVSKLITALSIARLSEQDLVDISSPVPWAAIGIARDPAWYDVTVRELLDHTSGMPVSRNSWLNAPGSCAPPLLLAMANPPQAHRGTWRYSNGNYCALGLLVESITGQRLDRAAASLIFGPLGIDVGGGTDGPHLTIDGPERRDAPYPLGLMRLDRLGGAGTWAASSRDIALMMDAITTDDRDVLRYPGIMRDQYGWGHTGTVDGAKACAWVMEGGRTVVVGLVAGNQPETGSSVCDALVLPLAVDLGLYVGDSAREPI